MSNTNLQEQLKDTLESEDGITFFYNIRKISKIGLGNFERLPYSIRILLENVIRNYEGNLITMDHVISLSKWAPEVGDNKEIPFIPARVLLQDFTGVPAMVDLAALRSAMVRAGGDPSLINPMISADLIIDHSIQVDYYGTKDAIDKNEKLEMERNRERYTFLKWSQNVFDNFRIIPTSRGICHQINLEYLAKVAIIKKINQELFIFPDTLIGTDSHTTMINGLGVLGWGVGGIEAEAVLLDKPYYMLVPEVVGVRLTGMPKDGISATDIVLHITQILRKHGVVGKFVEFFGPGLKNLSLEDRATIANMCPEYGATMGFFPVDDETIEYLKRSGRETKYVHFVKDYLLKVGLYYSSEESIPDYSEEIEINLNTIDPNLAGPKRPQDRIPLNNMKDAFMEQLNSVFKVSKENIKISDGNNFENGAIIIAAITSCTNTSNPSTMIAAGLLAKKAVERGMKVKNHVKTSFAPGSRVVTDYLKKAGLMEYLEKLGFSLVAYGCTTCIGNSGPIDDSLVQQINERQIIGVSILSGNRNFEGRISPHVKANYLVSPSLVIAFALAGTIAINLEKEPLGRDKNDNPVYLKDIWPSKGEINEYISKYVTSNLFKKEYDEIFKGWKLWNELMPPESDIYPWDENSTYIQEPPFFTDFSLERPPLENLENARVLAFLGDSVTTDHISPAGTISKSSPAGKYLISKGISIEDFNTYGSRRGNHEVLMRGTFSNPRIRNKLVTKEGGWTINHITGEIVSIYNAAMYYQKQGVPLIIIAGKDYGMGSSRDWAAKGPKLLGVEAIIAESYERIHRSNLIGMGILPLQFKHGENANTLNLEGTEIFKIQGIIDIFPGKELKVQIASQNGDNRSFDVISRLDTPVEVDYYKNKGILQAVLRDILRKE